MADAPAVTTADRLDRVAVGNLIHPEPPLLTTPTPVDGWQAVTAIDNDGTRVVLSLGDDPALTGAPDMLIRVGWAEPE